MKTIVRIHILWVLLFQPTFAQKADRIFYNGKIFTAHRKHPFAEALAITGSKITVVGSNARVFGYASSSTHMIDLHGRTVVPGFNSGHDHPAFTLDFGKHYQVPFTVDGPGIEATLDSVRQLVSQSQPGEWITGKIGLTVLKSASIRARLDSIAPNNPVQLQVMWGHGVVANTYLLRMLNISEFEPDPLGGWYARTQDGRLTGAMYEYAQWPVWIKHAASDNINYIDALRKYSEMQLAHGITSVQFMDFDYVYSKAFDDAKLNQHVRVVAFPGSRNHRRTTNDWQTAYGKKSNLLTVSGVKYLVEGSPLELGSLTKKPYSNDPKWFGRLNLPIDTLQAIIREAYQKKAPQMMLHINGDSTLAIVLSLMQKTGKDRVWRTKRVRFEHNPSSRLTPVEQSLIRKMGIIMAHTPQYGRNCKLTSLLNDNITVSISPDGTIDALSDIQIMVTQQDDPRENLSVEAAVIAYTYTNAFAEFEEKSKGTLTKGKFADFVVLSDDIFSIDKSSISTVSCVLTVVNGRIVYESGTSSCEY